MSEPESARTLHSGGTHRATLASVAARAGVSASTASLAFSGRGPVAPATRERVLNAARELNYSGPDPRASSLRRGSSGIVGVLLAERIGTSFRDPVLIQTLDGIAEELHGAGSSLLLIPDLEAGPVTASTAPIDALIMMSASAHATATAAILASRDIPVVQIEGPASPDIVNIRVDNVGGSRALAEHLRGLGHTRVAVVTFALGGDRGVTELTAEAEQNATVQTSRDRLRGAREIYPTLGGMIGGGSRTEAGHEAGLSLLRVAPDRRPTAIIAQSDLLAIGVIAAAEECGLRVPEDLSVVGFDGARIEGFDRNLTTVWQPSQEKGAAAGRTVLALIDGQDVGDTEFGVRLVPGDTSGPVPGGA